MYFVVIVMYVETLPFKCKAATVRTGCKLGIHSIFMYILLKLHTVIAFKFCGLRLHQQQQQKLLGRMTSASQSESTDLFKQMQRISTHNPTTRQDNDCHTTEKKMYFLLNLPLLKLVLNHLVWFAALTSKRYGSHCCFGGPIEFFEIILIRLKVCCGFHDWYRVVCVWHYCSHV